MTETSRELPKKRVGSGVAIVDQEMRVLLVEPTYKETWEVPGGMVELDESPREAARRECFEELRSWEWCDSSAVSARVQAFQARRIFAALDALRNETFVELENGNRT